MGRPLLRVLLRAGGFSDPAASQQHFDEAFWTVEHDVTALQAAVPRTDPENIPVSDRMSISLADRDQDAVASITATAAHRRQRLGANASTRGN